MYPELKSALERSEALHTAMGETLGDEIIVETLKDRTALNFCTLSFEYAISMRILLREGFAVPATGLMRPQYEALVKAFWFRFCASAEVIERINSPLSLESEKATKNLPGIRDMLTKLEKTPEVPAPAVEQLRLFEQISLNALHSYAHGGIHAIARHADGFPVQLAVSVLYNSNGLATMAGMLMAVVSGSAYRAKALNATTLEFADCLPMPKKREQTAPMGKGSMPS
ncbi:hypothetical protein [Pseudomonas nitroreducens]|uniref:DUF6988 family protein n=1 Tax=Pseudomonas nitroreducens TaxID=46680 RepID=UPI00351D6BBD